MMKLTAERQQLSEASRVPPRHTFVVLRRSRYCDD